MAQNAYLTNLASEFYVISVLCRLGYDASLSLGNKKQVDITVVLAEGLARTIDVKAVAGKNDWFLGRALDHVAPNHFVVLVGYEGQFADATATPRVWVIPSSRLRRLAKTTPKGNVTYISRKAFLTRKHSYENAWHLLGQPA